MKEVMVEIIVPPLASLGAARGAAIRPTPSSQFDPDPATGPSNPDQMWG